jgi:hypothetical protein
MASSYTTRLRLEKPGVGEQSGTWGGTANTDFDLLDAAFGTSSITHDDTANYTLTANNGSSDEARAMVYLVGGALTAARNAVVPTVTRLFLGVNNTTGGFALTFKTTAGTGISVANGKKKLLYCDGTNVVDAATTLGDAELEAIAALAVTDGNIIVGDGSTWVAESGATARTSLGLGTGDSPQFTAVNVGHASDTTITRTGAGDIAVEGNAVYRAGGTDVPVVDGGTGLSTATAYAVLCGGTTGTGAFQSIAGVGTSGQFLTSNGAGALPTFQTATPSGLVLIQAQTPSSVAALDFTTGINSTYEVYKLIGWLQPATDDVELWLRISDDGGSTFEADAADYRYRGTGNNDGGTNAALVSASDTAFDITSSDAAFAVGNAAAASIRCEITVTNPDSATLKKVISSQAAWVDPSGRAIGAFKDCIVTATAAINGLRLLFESGDIAAGHVALYGLRNA